MPEPPALGRVTCPLRPGAPPSRIARAAQPPGPLDEQAVAVDARHAALDLVGAVGTDLDAQLVMSTPDFTVA